MNQQHALIRRESIDRVPTETSTSYSHGLANRSRGPDIPSAATKTGPRDKRQAQNPLQPAIQEKSTVIDELCTKTRNFNYIPIKMFHKSMQNPGEETVRGISWGSFVPVSIWISGADDFVQEERESQPLPLCFSMGGRGRLRREGDARRGGSGHFPGGPGSYARTSRTVELRNARVPGPWTRCTQVPRGVWQARLHRIWSTYLWKRVSRHDFGGPTELWP